MKTQLAANMGEVMSVRAPSQLNWAHAILLFMIAQRRGSLIQSREHHAPQPILLSQLLPCATKARSSTGRLLSSSKTRSTKRHTVGSSDASTTAQYCHLIAFVPGPSAALSARLILAPPLPMRGDRRRWCLRTIMRRFLSPPGRGSTWRRRWSASSRASSSRTPRFRTARSSSPRTRS